MMEPQQCTFHIGRDALCHNGLLVLVYLSWPKCSREQTLYQLVVPVSQQCTAPTVGRDKEFHGRGWSSSNAHVQSERHMLQETVEQSNEFHDL